MTVEAGSSHEAQPAQPNASSSTSPPQCGDGMGGGGPGEHCSYLYLASAGVAATGPVMQPRRQAERPGARRKPRTRLSPSPFLLLLPSRRATPQPRRCQRTPGCRSSPSPQAPCAELRGRVRNGAGLGRRRANGISSGRCLADKAICS